MARVKYTKFVGYRETTTANGDPHTHAVIGLHYVDAQDMQDVELSMTVDEYESIKHRIGNNRIYGRR